MLPLGCNEAKETGERGISLVSSFNSFLYQVCAGAATYGTAQMYFSVRIVHVNVKYNMLRTNNTLILINVFS